MGDKYKRMDDDDIERLIKARIIHADLFKKKFYRRHEVWSEIQKTAQLEEFTLEQLRIKWNYLHKKYKNILSPPAGTSLEEEIESADNWKWFELMQKFGQTQTCITAEVPEIVKEAETSSKRPSKTDGSINFCESCESKASRFDMKIELETLAVMEATEKFNREIEIKKLEMEERKIAALNKLLNAVQNGFDRISNL